MDATAPKSDCRDFGARAANLLLASVGSFVPKIHRTVYGAIAERQLAGMLIIVSRFAFDTAVEASSVERNCALSITNGAAREFERAIAEAFDLTPSSANTLYLDAADDIRKALRRNEASDEDASIMIRALIGTIERGKKVSELPAASIALFDVFFQATTNAILDSIKLATFTEPDLVKDILGLE